MQLNDKDIRNIIEEVVKRYLSSSENSEVKDTPVVTRAEERVGNKLELIDEGQAQKGTRSDEVIIAVAPAFGVYQTETITHIPHADVLKEIMAGIEEEGLALRGSFVINPEGKIVAYEVHDNGIGREAKELLRKLQGAKFVAEHGEVCPAKWQPGSETLKPSLDLIGEL